MQNPDISFVQLKLANIGTALFYCGAGSQLPFSTYIITALKADKDGHIWFFINRSQPEQNVFMPPFDAQLEFYRKGYPFFMRIEGQAIVADAKEYMHELMGKGISLQEETLSGILLIKVKMKKCIYKELKDQKTFQPLAGISHWLKNILHPSQPQWHPTPAVS